MQRIARMAKKQKYGCLSWHTANSSFDSLSQEHYVSSPDLVVTSHSYDTSHPVFLRLCDPMPH